MEPDNLLESDKDCWVFYGRCALRIVARCRYQEQEPKDILYAPIYPECCANRFFRKVFRIGVARSICDAPDYE